MKQLGEEEIRAGLAAYRTARKVIPDLIRAARDAGLTIQEIHRLSGVSRTTIYRILGLDGDTE